MIAPSHFKTGLYVISTPIGNLGDISIRAKECLKNMDVIACEDTRVTKKLLQKLSIAYHKSAYLKSNTQESGRNDETGEKRLPLLVSYNDYSDIGKINYLLSVLKNGGRVGLVSDAGTPLISDPGFQFVKMAIDNDIDIFPIPGASAVMAAIAVSGLPSDRFSFLGFPPNKKQARMDFLRQLSPILGTIILYESPHRILKLLADIHEVFPKKHIVVLRELTKIYEEVLRNPVDEILAFLQKRKAENNALKGEYVVMFHLDKGQEQDKWDDISLGKKLSLYMQQSSLKDSVDRLVSETNINKNKIYNLALGLKKK
jgi:16S rRNA (cytidine1402-2'-O)-methyltransferase